MIVAEHTGRTQSGLVADNGDSMPIPAGFMRIGGLTILPTLLATLGHDPNLVATRFGMNAELFHDPDTLISIAECNHMIAGCADLTGREHFGLRLGQQVGLSSMGVTGQLARNAKDVGSALRDIVRYLHMHRSGVIAKLEIEGGTAVFSHRTYDPDFEGEQTADRVLAGVCSMMRSMCGSEWTPDEVLVPHRRPRDVEPFSDYFRAPVRFNQEGAALVFATRWLQQPVPGADPAAYRKLADHLERIDISAEHDITDQLRRAVHTLLHNRKFSSVDVAQMFSIHRRTMGRRLKQNGTQFHLLLEEAKFQVARQLIRHTDLPLVEIAAVLNYSEAGAFTRAFKRWSGISPSLWRQKHLHS
jgi:AraC-like DNA-binding protein